MSRCCSFAMVTVLSLVVWACATTPVPNTPSTIIFQKPVHFSSPDGADAEVAIGMYRVEQATEKTLRLVPQESKDPILILAQVTKHDQPLSDTLALSIPYQEDEHHVVLLKPDGSALDAVGTYSGVKSRAAATLVPLSRPLIQQYRLTQQQLGGTGSSTPPPNTNPDFVITSATMMPASPSPYDLAVLQLTVKNQGLTDAKLDVLNAAQLTQGYRHLTVQLWDSTGKPVKGWGMEPANLPVTIPAGSSQVLTVREVTLLTDVAGTFKWDVTLNSYITEANTGNNTYSTTFTVQPRPPITGPAPDLALTGCSFTPANPTQRDIIQVFTQYTNTGTVAANFPYTAPLLQWTSSPAIAGRSSFRWGVGNQVASGAAQAFQSQLNFAQTAPGTYQITVVVDPDNRVGESNEGNNSVVCTLEVGP